MKKVLFLAVTSLLSTQAILAQNAPSQPGNSTPAIIRSLLKGNGKIAGIILDEAAKKPV